MIARPNTLRTTPGRSTEWMGITAMVVLIHLALLLPLRTEDKIKVILGPQTMEVEIQSPAAPQSQPETVKQPTQAISDPTPKIVEAPKLAANLQEVATPTSTPAEAPPPPSPAAVADLPPAVQDSEPDYKAAYLNNPPPYYPATARRLGMQGKVLLRVEILSNGTCGQIEIESSSGFRPLDQAALETVKKWHFVPARHGVLATTRWFTIPIRFSIE